MKQFWYYPISLVLISLVVFARPHAAWADNLYVSHFLGANAKTCYGRTYSDHHLAKHPKQKVRTIALQEISETETESRGAVVSFDLKFGAIGREKPAKYWGVAYCETDGNKATCHVEGDGGMFTLAPKKETDGLVLETNGVGFEGDADFLHFGNKSDDKVFHIEKTSSASCDAFQ